MRLWWSVIVAMGCAHDPLDTEPVPAPIPAPVPPAPKRLSPTALKLSQVELFGLGGVGDAGTQSPGETLAKQLATEPDAIAQFEQLTTVDNRAARLYAYWALRTLDPPRAKAHEAALSFDATDVKTISGCIVMTDKTNDVAKSLQDDHHPMPAP